MLALVDPTTIKSMIEHQVYDVIGNYGLATKEWNINQGDKEGRYKHLQGVYHNKQRPFYGDV